MWLHPSGVSGRALDRGVAEGTEHRGPLALEVERVERGERLVREVRKGL